MSPNPVTPEQVAIEIGADPTDPRLIDATEAAWALVEQDLDWTAVYPSPDPWPEPVIRATVGCAVDLFRSPGTAFGYFINDVGIASTGTDVLRRWRHYLDPYRNQWGLA